MNELRRIEDKLDSLQIDVATIKANTMSDRKMMDDHKSDLGAHTVSIVTWGTFFSAISAGVYHVLHIK